VNIIEDLSVSLFGNVILGERLPIPIVTISSPIVCLIPANRKVTEKHLRVLANNLTDFQTNPSNTPIESKLREVSQQILAKASRRLAGKPVKRPALTLADQIRQFIEHYDATTELLEKHLKPQLKDLLAK